MCSAVKAEQERMIDPRQFASSANELLGFHKGISRMHITLPEHSMQDWKLSLPVPVTLPHFNDRKQYSWKALLNHCPCLVTVVTNRKLLFQTQLWNQNTVGLLHPSHCFSAKCQQ